MIQDIEEIKCYYDYLNRKSFIDEVEEKSALEKNKRILINQLNNCNSDFLLKLYEKAKDYDETGWEAYRTCREILNINLSELYYVSEPDFFIDKSGHELTEMCEKIYFKDSNFNESYNEYKKGFYKLSIKKIIYNMDTVTYKYFLEDVFNIIKDFIVSMITEDNKILFNIYNLLLNSL